MCQRLRKVTQNEPTIRVGSEKDQTFVATGSYEALRVSRNQATV